MHVAVCDDNIADRKQLERLLGRESDERLHTTGVLYVDSFGNSTALFRAPKIYDVFFIDMVEGAMNGADLAASLRADGITAPIVLCSSVIDYTRLATLPDNIFHMSKPISPAALSEMLSRAYEIKAALIPKIAIRGDTDTYYVPAEDIMYVIPNTHYYDVVLSDGTVHKMFGTFNGFTFAFESYPQFIVAGRHMIINASYVTAVMFHSVTMQDGTILKISRHDKKMLTAVYKKYGKN